jgi:hypothetical protein
LSSIFFSIYSLSLISFPYIIHPSTLFLSPHHYLSATGIYFKTQLTRLFICI